MNSGLSGIRMRRTGRKVSTISRTTRNVKVIAVFQVAIKKMALASVNGLEFNGEERPSFPPHVDANLMNSGLSGIHSRKIGRKVSAVYKLIESVKVIAAFQRAIKKIALKWVDGRLDNEQMKTN